MDTIISLCDLSGTWSQPYAAAGYRVIRIDPSHGEMVTGERGMVTDFSGDGSIKIMDDGGEGWAMTSGQFVEWLKDPANVASLGRVRGVLMAPPCTDFSVSGNQHWPAKDADGRTAQSVLIVKECLQVKDILQPDFWVLENPVGRLPTLVPEIGPRGLIFNPCDYAGHLAEPEKEAYTKKTCLYGTFNSALVKSPVEPVMYERVGKNGKVYRGSWMWANLGGKSAKTKALRSATPKGFSAAFFGANNPLGEPVEAIAA